MKMLKVMLMLVLGMGVVTAEANDPTYEEAVQKRLELVDPARVRLYLERHEFILPNSRFVLQEIRRLVPMQSEGDLANVGLLRSRRVPRQPLERCIGARISEAPNQPITWSCRNRRTSAGFSEGDFSRVEVLAIDLSRAVDSSRGDQSQCNVGRVETSGNLDVQPYLDFMREREAAGCPPGFLTLRLLVRPRANR